jgi:O-antigen/teichoic acid export membrane protein
MCACGCFIVAALIAVVVYGVMHGLWLIVGGAILVACVLAWFGKKMAGGRTHQKTRGT